MSAQKPEGSSTSHSQEPAAAPKSPQTELIPPAQPPTPTGPLSQETPMVSEANNTEHLPLAQAPANPGPLSQVMPMVSEAKNTEHVPPAQASANIGPLSQETPMASEANNTEHLPPAQAPANIGPVSQEMTPMVSEANNTEHLPQVQAPANTGPLSQEMPMVSEANNTEHLPPAKAPANPGPLSQETPMVSEPNSTEHLQPAQAPANPGPLSHETPMVSEANNTEHLPPAQAPASRETPTVSEDNTEHLPPAQAPANPETPMVSEANNTEHLPPAKAPAIPGPLSHETPMVSEANNTEHLPPAQAPANPEMPMVSEDNTEHLPPAQVPANPETPMLSEANYTEHLPPVQAPANPEMPMVSEANYTEHLLPALAPANPGLPPHAMHKNRLQEYTQRSALPLPIYQNDNEGSQHAPKYRSTVLVDGIHFTSPNTFSHRKAAEQDVARIALLHIHQKLQNEAYPLIHEDTVFCKSILIEYAVKMGLPKPSYRTVLLSHGLLPIFVSSLVFNGVRYIGDTAKTKKEAEQLAARAVILAILDTEARTAMYEIIKSKFKLYAALHKVKDSLDAQNGTGPEKMNTEAYSQHLANVLPAHPPIHEYKRRRFESSSETINPPVVFVPPAMVQPQILGSNLERKRKKKSGKRKMQISAQLPLSVMPLSQTSFCSAAQ